LAPEKKFYNIDPSPAYCETVFQKDGSKTMRINMERALIDFQHGFDASIVSDECFVFYKTG
jgi:hypothetical protein